MVKWLNHVTIAAPRNGSNTHAVDPAAGAVVAGAAFTPTAGRLLVVLVEGPVTSTTPPGWTLPAGGSAIDITGLYLWYRTAAGGDTFETTHNGSNFPVSFDIYEFPADATFIEAAAATGVPANGSSAGPSLSSLDASATFRSGVVGQGVSGGTVPAFTWDSGTEAVDAGVAAGDTDGYGYSLVYEEDQVGASYSVAATSTITITSVERIVFALAVPDGSGTEHPATGTIATTTTTAGEATVQHAAAGTIPVVTEALGTAEVAGLSATGTIAVVTGATGTANQRHTATGSIAIQTAANGAPTKTAREGGMTPFLSVLETLQKVLDVLITPEASGGCPLTTQPCRVALYPGGEVAFDACGTSCSGGREGQLWANLQPATVNVSAGNSCQVITFTAEIGITRCAPAPKNDGSPPSVEAVAAAAWQQALDADEILVALTCCDALTGNDRDKLTLSAWRPVDPSGDCLGGVWTITGALSMCC